MKQSSQTLVSVILPVSNSEEHLRECLTSLLNQTYSDIEIIAVDDNSVDDSWRILKSLAKTDKRLKPTKNIKKYGLTVTLNRAVRRAKGHYIAFMRASDKASLHRIKRQVTFLETNPKVAAVSSQINHIGGNGKVTETTTYPLTHDEIYPTLPQASSLFHFEGALINRTLIPLDLLKFTGVVYPHIYSDVFLKITQYGQLANINQPLYSYRCSIQKERHKQTRQEMFFATISLWIKSFAQYDYRPTLRSLFTQFAK